MDHIKWTSLIVEALWAKNERRLKAHRTELIQANTNMGNSPDGFLFGGAFHTNLKNRDARDVVKAPLHPSLREAGQDYMDDLKVTDSEKIRLTNGVGAILRRCSNEQDIRDALPDTVVSFFPELTKLSRTREEGWPFRNSAFKTHDYQKTAELLDFYAAQQLIY